MPSIHPHTNLLTRLPRRRLLQLALLTVMLLALAAIAWAEGPWATYVNPRFGTTADYPADVFTELDEPPENGDGQGFRSEDGQAQLLIYGQHNVRRDSPQSYLEKYVDLAGVEVTLRQVTDRFYVVSGIRGSRVLYERCNFPLRTDGIVHCLGLSFPAKHRAKWDPIAARIANSLRSGSSTEAH
jgi:hypothetical protein